MEENNNSPEREIEGVTTVIIGKPIINEEQIAAQRQWHLQVGRRRRHWLVTIGIFLALVGFLGFLLLRFLRSFQSGNNAPPPDYLTSALDEIHDGKILFNPPREMEQGKAERVETRISYQDIGDAITKHLRGRGEPQTETIQVGEKMTVTLSANETEFNIKKYGPDEELVAGRPFAQWEWDVM